MHRLKLRDTPEWAVFAGTLFAVAYWRLQIAGHDPLGDLAGSELRTIYVAFSTLLVGTLAAVFTAIAIVFTLTPKRRLKKVLDRHADGFVTLISKIVGVLFLSTLVVVGAAVFEYMMPTVPSGLMRV